MGSFDWVDLCMVKHGHRGLEGLRLKEEGQTWSESWPTLQGLRHNLGKRGWAPSCYLKSEGRGSRFYKTNFHIKKFNKIFSIDLTSEICSLAPRFSNKFARAKYRVLHPCFFLFCLPAGEVCILKKKTQFSSRLWRLISRLGDLGGDL